jgi:hypothetical protein
MASKIMIFILDVWHPLLHSADPFVRVRVEYRVTSENLLKKKQKI